MFVLRGADTPDFFSCFFWVGSLQLYCDIFKCLTIVLSQVIPQICNVTFFKDVFTIKNCMNCQKSVNAILKRLTKIDNHVYYLVRAQKYPPPPPPNFRIPYLRVYKCLHLTRVYPKTGVYTPLEILHPARHINMIS